MGYDVGGLSSGEPMWGSERAGEGLVEQGLLQLVEGGELARLYIGLPSTLSLQAVETFDDPGLLIERRQPDRKRRNDAHIEPGHDRALGLCGQIRPGQRVVQKVEMQIVWQALLAVKGMTPELLVQLRQIAG